LSQLLGWTQPEPNQQQLPSFLIEIKNLNVIELNTYLASIHALHPPSSPPPRAPNVSSQGFVMPKAFQRIIDLARALRPDANCLDHFDSLSCEQKLNTLLFASTPAKAIKIPVHPLCFPKSSLPRVRPLYLPRHSALHTPRSRTGC
jgi:hypothetical protein